MNIKDLKIIAVHGPLNSGKDTVANYIKDKFPGRFERYAFAGPLKEAAKVMFMFTDEQLEDQILKKEIDAFWGFSPRTAMQLLGTEYARGMLRDDVWIKRAELAMEREGLNKGLIISDCRFENEAEWVRAQPNSILIHLKTLNLEQDYQHSHASEAGLKFEEGDLEIQNDKSKGLDVLYKQIDDLFPSNITFKNYLS